MNHKNLERILLVEDEEDIRTIASMALETVGGFTVASCDSGQKALDRAPGFGPDLILLDVMMPGMDGPTTLANLRLLPGLETAPVVFMTAKVMPAEVEHYLELGALGVVPKPFDPMKLPGQITDIWNASRPDERR
jgi:CheY-like chemotaxis protein